MSHIITDARAQAALVLADGKVFTGRSFGAAGMVTAEVVFNTAMTGYQEILATRVRSSRSPILTSATRVSMKRISKAAAWPPPASSSDARARS